ncbi:uncharacterized protein LOC134698069 [Mytilus trossulus]|uniref:uncharacterized protein LOC134698069 n=1 Tax=Mytilus trossulus TaxID=6551 RepID=UPI0030078C8E
MSEPHNPQEYPYNGKQKKQKNKWKNNGSPQVVPVDDDNGRNKRDPQKKKKSDKGDDKQSNRFAESKNFIQTIADVSLMMANISQLRAVLERENIN